MWNGGSAATTVTSYGCVRDILNLFLDKGSMDFRKDESSQLAFENDIKREGNSIVTVIEIENWDNWSVDGYLKVNSMGWLLLWAVSILSEKPP